MDKKDTHRSNPSDRIRDKDRDKDKDNKERERQRQKEKEKEKEKLEEKSKSETRREKVRRSRSPKRRSRSDSRSRSRSRSPRHRSVDPRLANLDVLNMTYDDYLQAVSGQMANPYMNAFAFPGMFPNMPFNPSSRDRSTKY
eukprot:TRINITY_DN9585_c1_g1_i1.p1 TRINITY_DN9585_c1_g1~~TRINITY_DN9585_c1_g1_i1.p1  ORF type:complete len:141 (+),score=38.30 TRINITY_DN9585_c1_g1_i1:803-1225(+)